MIHRTNRFHGRGSLTFVYKRGQTVRGPFVTMRYIRNQRMAEYRVAVVVSRKVSKSAVVRNRIRRRMYEAVREIAPNIVEPYDIIFVVYGEDLARIKSSELRKVVHQQLTTAGIIRVNNASAQRENHAIVEQKETNT